MKNYDYLANSKGECRKCGESGLFTLKMKEKHCQESPDCMDFLHGGSTERMSTINLVSARDLCSMSFPEEEWLAKGLIPTKGVVFLGGKRSSMKTWGALDLALAVTQGGLFLNHFQTIKRDVIFLDAENGEGQIQKRLKMMLGEAQAPDNLHFVFFPKLNLDEDSGPLKEILEGHEGAVIIIDSFRRVLNFDENDAQGANQVFVHQIRPLIEQFDATFVLLHHLRKGSGKGVSDHLDELRGSSELVNYADAVILFERSKTDSTIVMRHPKNRSGVELPPCKIEVQASEASFSLNYVGSFEDIQNQPELAGEAILKWAFEAGKSEFKTSEAQMAVKSEFNYRMISRALGELCTKKKITKLKKGVYTVISSKQSKFETKEPMSNSCPIVPSSASDNQNNGTIGQSRLQLSSVLTVVPSNG